MTGGRSFGSLVETFTHIFDVSTQINHANTLNVRARDALRG